MGRRLRRAASRCHWRMRTTISNESKSPHPHPLLPHALFLLLTYSIFKYVSLLNFPGIFLDYECEKLNRCVLEYQLKSSFTYGCWSFLGRVHFSLLYCQIFHTGPRSLKPNTLWNNIGENSSPTDASMRSCFCTLPRFNIVSQENLGNYSCGFGGDAKINFVLAGNDPRRHPE